MMLSTVKLELCSGGADYSPFRNFLAQLRFIAFFLDWRVFFSLSVRSGVAAGGCA
jgi:hypothetical protein